MLLVRRAVPILFVVAVPLCGLISCASVSLKESRRADAPLVQRPERFLVEPFSFEPERVQVGRNGRDLEEFKSEVSARMTAYLLRRLPEVTGIPAQAASRGSVPTGGNVWLIRGHFDRLNQGSRLLRAVVGLGAGGTKMETTVVVYDLSAAEPRPILLLRTSGGSNISPGIGGVATFWISGPMAFTSLFNVVEGVRSGVSFDADRTSREIGAAIAEFLHENGLTEGERPRPPKRAGQLGPVL